MIVSLVGTYKAEPARVVIDHVMAHKKDDGTFDLTGIVEVRSESSRGIMSNFKVHMNGDLSPDKFDKLYEQVQLIPEFSQTYFKPVHVKVEDAAPSTESKAAPKKRVAKPKSKEVK